MRLFGRTLLLAALVAVLTACGAKGPLVLPEEKPAEPEQPAQ